MYIQQEGQPVYIQQEGTARVNQEREGGTARVNQERRGEEGRQRGAGKRRRVVETATWSREE